MLELRKHLAKSNSCFKCHSVDKEKKWLSFQKISLKYKSKANSQILVFDAFTKDRKVKFADGSEDNHKIIDTTDVNSKNNLSSWILSQ